jgi:general L-amino acid transport system ATP-binding protein
MNIEKKASEGQMIEFIDVHKWFGEFHVLQGINLSVDKQERIVICGPSGSGKSTLIRCINRLEEHQRGRIVVDGIELTNNIKNIEKIRAEVGMVFQHFNLFPHLTIVENLSLGPIWVRKVPKKKPKRRPCITWKRCILLNRPGNIPANFREANSSVSPLPAACV